MAIKPTTDDLVGWLKLQTDPTQQQLDVYDECIATAIDDIESRCDLPAGTTDDNYPQRLRMAEILQAARLAKRPGSPEGVAGMADLGTVVHIMGRDPDIERLILRFRKTTGFA